MNDVRANEVMRRFGKAYFKQDPALLADAVTDDVEWHFAMGSDQIVMTYLLDGKHRGGDSFNLRGVELITVKDGKVHRKDVFWKQYRGATT